VEQGLYKLPEGWKWQNLSEVSVKIGSGSTPRGGRKAYKSEGISLIRSLNVYDDGFKIKGLAFIDDGQGSKLSNVVVEENDVLLNITGASIARCCIVPSDLLPARVNQHVSIIRLKRNLLPTFLRVSLISPHMKKFLLNRGSGGATRQALTKVMLENLYIPLPPLNEQKRIVAKLDALFTRIDTAITHLQQTLELSKSLFASALDEAVRPKEIPNNWIKGKFGEFASFSQGLQIPVGDQIHEFSEGLVQFLRISDFVRDDEPARYIQDPGDRYKVREQDLSMIRYGDAGKVVRGYSGAIANNLFRINATDVFNVDFLYYLLSSPSVYGFLRAGNTSSTMPAISFKVVKNIPVAIPPKDEQKKIVTHLDALSERTHTLEVTTQEKINDLTALKASLLDSAFKGEL